MDNPLAKFYSWQVSSVIHRENRSMVGMFRFMGGTLGSNHRYTMGDIRGIR